MVPSGYVTAYPTATRFSWVFTSADDSPGSVPMASWATPIAADWVRAPLISPAPSPGP